MMLKLRFLLAFLLALLSGHGALAQGQTDLTVGQVIGNNVGQVVNGWTQVGGSQYQSRETRNYVTVEGYACCVAVFRNGDTYLFAATSPIAKTASGGVEAERIVAIRKIAIPRAETPVSCSLLWIDPAASFSSGPGKQIRSVIFTGADFVEIRWFDPGKYCDYGD